VPNKPAVQTVVNAMTVDVEDYFHVQAFATVIPRRDWDRYPMRVEHNTARVLEIFAARDTRATFFVLGWVAERCPKLVRSIFKAGHQIGCHGYDHRPVSEGSELDFRRDIRRAKQIIEDTVGAPVNCYRAPSYSITSRTLWALEILGEEGFDSDSSIYPILHDTYGIRGAPRFPHIKYLKCGRQLKEFPPSTLRIMGANVPVAGGGYLRLYPYNVTAWALHHLNDAEGRPGMVYLHPWELDPDQPRIPSNWLSKFRHYQNLHSTQAKCVRLLSEFSWAPLDDVLTDSLAHSSEQWG
jgi:polysaccharide deacetylase family protein (PEP-CTERM system associated)